MKNSIFLFLLFLPFAAFSQTKADSISLTFPKILILNGQQEVLLIFDSNRKAYEVPSTGVIRGPVSFKNYIDAATREIGVTHVSYRIGGLFTYLFPDKYRTLIRPYFVVHITGYTNGRGVADAAYKWFPLRAALKEIKYPASALIVEKVLHNPKTVWSATFEEYGYTSPVDVSRIKFRIVEDFAKIN
ncbi:MAG: NUDIX hydrolase [Hymenobacter sp.]|nr:MAG: NUDIX hydrolase [Hymenobacter sp.]